MTGQGVVAPTGWTLPLWQLAGSNVVLHDVLASFEGGGLLGGAGDASLPGPDLAYREALQKIQLAPFRDRLKLRRQRYVPLQQRSPWQTLAPLFVTEQWELQAAGQWQEQGPLLEASTTTIARTGGNSDGVIAQEQSALGDFVTPSAEQYWVMARLRSLDSVAKAAGEAGDIAAATVEQEFGFISWEPYLYVGISSQGDLSLRLLPVSHQSGLQVVCSTLDGVGREFKIAAQASFIQRVTQLQEIQLELRQEFAIRQSLYNALAHVHVRPSQALRYFDRLLDETPYPPSKTPASDRLLLRRQLLKRFTSVAEPSLWDAYAAVTHWVNYGSSGQPAQRWWSCCHGPGAKMLRQALAYAVAVQYDQQETSGDSTPRSSGAQRSLEASDALQARIQQLRNGVVMAEQSIKG